jgi:propanol-preferring alcohol dehydrogenase
MCQGDHEQLCEKRVLSGKDVDGCWAGESEVRRWVAEHQSINSVYGASDHTLVDSEYLLPIPEDVDAAEVAPILCAGNISGERLMFQQSLMAVQERPSTVL